MRASAAWLKSCPFVYLYICQLYGPACVCNSRLRRLAFKNLMKFVGVQVMVARDLIIADAICRHFWWHTLMLFADELPRGTVVSLSLDDELVPCALVQKQLQEQLARDARSGPEAAVASPHEQPRSDQDLHSSPAPAKADLSAGTTQARGRESAVQAVQVFVSQGAHGVFVVKPALQRELIAAWQTSIAQLEVEA